MPESFTRPVRLFGEQNEEDVYIVAEITSPGRASIAERIARRFQFTAARIKQLPLHAHEESGRSYRIHWDKEVHGFGVRVGTKKKTFIAQRNLPRAKTATIVTIGTADVWTVESAREAARHVLIQIGQGIDPNVEKRHRVVGQEGEKITLLQAFEERSVKWKPSTLAQNTRMFFGTTKKNKKKDGFFSDWQDLPIREITREMVRQKHDALAKDHSSRYADLCMKVLGGILNHAGTKHSDSRGMPLLEINPVGVLRGSWQRPKRRESLLDEKQLPVWLAALEQMRNDKAWPSGPVGADYLEFILFTGTRRSEAARLMWSDIDFEAKTAVFRGTKNGKDHKLPLTDHLVDLLNRRKLDSGNSDYVFRAAWRNKGVGYLGEPKFLTKRLAESCKFKCTIHDLRRTFATSANRIGVDIFKIKRLLNHAMPSDVTAGYIPPNVEDLRESMQKITGYFKQFLPAPSSAQPKN